ncbi:2-polyprenyl-6-methoxyphenol hydroxylase [Rhizobiales bacterium GAS191]|jgi:2-polyprenyl-6-methoxyphenol hydroxylase-like FAD-dependent oxidoreductase|nr:2-polyprenyl-6-methoxyphenol hydroxylase [Rhizobiales bacterium GAS188]SEC82129.1 2-polyprenyl-6-methoxyphenol hydroxylase [Rhizobiales bacterium GAS191]
MDSSPTPRGPREQRHAEIAGGGFAGLAAACALARRGWSVRVHERAEQLRTTGAGIYIYENGLRVLEALGAYEEAVRGAPLAHTREVRDERNEVVSVHRWGETSRVFSILRQQVIDALAAAARRAGVEIVTSSEAVAATPEGELVLADGQRLKADLVVAADGANSKLRQSLGLLSRKTSLADGAIRLLIDKTPEERRSGEDGKTIEYWSGNRRVLYTPCSATQIYIALTMLDRDAEARTVPIRPALWKASFPHLAALIDRIGEAGRYDRFEVVKLRRWSSGKVAVIGDAAHALPPNIGQGAGCSMMNALALAVYLEETPDIEAALAAWELKERPLTEHTQRISVFLGLPTAWPAALRRLFFTLAGRSQWLIRQRTRTALHKPVGTVP